MRDSRAFDYAECNLHLRGLPTRSKIQDLHRYWFDTGIPLVIELERSSSPASRSSEPATNS